MDVPPPTLRESVKSCFRVVGQCLLLAHEKISVCHTYLCTKRASSFTHARTLALTFPPKVSCRTPSSFFFLNLQSTQRDTEKTLTETLRLSLEFFFSQVLKVSESLKQRVNDAEWRKRNRTIEASLKATGEFSAPGCSRFPFPFFFPH